MLSTVGLAGVGAAVTAGCDATPAPKTTPSSGPSRDSGRVTAPPPRGVLGANMNGDADWADLSELRAVNATWLRGFYPMPDADHGAVAAQPVIRTLLTARARGYGTMLSLKFPYFSQPIPAPGSPAMATALRRLAAVLPAVMGKVDILVIGNEPFIECRAQDRGDGLNKFYETVARHVISYRGRHNGGTGTRLYMGALNHLDLPGWRTAATERWMSYVRETPDLDGVDIHPHLPAVNAGQAYLRYVLPRLRADQTFLATEFSLVLLWAKHMRDPVTSEFTSRYNLPPGTLVWQAIQDSIRHPYSQQKWNDFLAMSPWFADNKNFLRDQVGKFRATGRLAAATYGITQDTDMIAHFGPDSTPWLLNSLFCPYTVQRGADGLPGQTASWADEFRTLQ
jgi:hypothetical protein